MAMASERLHAAAQLQLVVPSPTPWSNRGLSLHAWSSAGPCENRMFPVWSRNSLLGMWYDMAASDEECV
jgi:hypothetical protein